MKELDKLDFNRAKMQLAMLDLDNEILLEVIIAHARNEELVAKCHRALALNRVERKKIENEWKELEQET